MDWTSKGTYKLISERQITYIGVVQQGEILALAVRVEWVSMKEEISFTLKAAGDPGPWKHWCYGEIVRIYIKIVNHFIFSSLYFPQKTVSTNNNNIADSNNNIIDSRELPSGMYYLII